MVFNSLWFFFPGLYLVISNSICLKSAFKRGRNFMDTLSHLKCKKLYGFISVHYIILYKNRFPNIS